MSEWLQHHGIKGMKWGVRKWKYNPIKSKIHYDFYNPGKVDDYRKIAKIKHRRKKDIFYAGRNAIKEKSKNTMKSVLNKAPNYSNSVLSKGKFVNVKGKVTRHASGFFKSPNMRSYNREMKPVFDAADHLKRSNVHHTPVNRVSVNHVKSNGFTSKVKSIASNPRNRKIGIGVGAAVGTAAAAYGGYRAYKAYKAKKERKGRR